MTERGRIRSREHALVERDFSGLRWGAITPTDIDGFLEFSDRLFVLIESKFGGASLGGGQMLALQRLVDAVHCPPRRICTALVIDQVDAAGVVDYAALNVRTYRWFGQWRRPARDLTCRHAIDKLLAFSRNQRARIVRGDARGSA